MYCMVESVLKQLHVCDTCTGQNQVFRHRSANDDASHALTWLADGIEAGMRWWSAAIKERKYGPTRGEASSLVSAENAKIQRSICHCSSRN